MIGLKTAARATQGQQDSARGAREADPLAEAAGAVGLVVALNKPVYPIYVWFIAESAFYLAMIAGLTMPLYLAVWIAARKGWNRVARIGVVVVGIADTMMIAFLLGGDSGTLAFLFACLMLAGQAFYDGERWLSRALIAFTFLAIVAFYDRIGAPVLPILPEDMDSLRYLNVTGAAALAAFVALRFPRQKG